MLESEFVWVPLLPTILLIIPSFYLLYKWSVRNHDYWKKRGIPYVKTVPLLGSLLDAFRKPLHVLEQERYNELGRIYGHFEGNKVILSVADPVLLKGILVKDFFNFPDRRELSTGDKVIDSMMSLMHGEDWKRVRNIITPTFSSGKIRKMMSIFDECSKTVVKNFKSSSDAGETIDTKRVFGAFSMDVIASAAFSTKIDSHNDPNNVFVQNARSTFTSKIGFRFMMVLAFPRLMKWLGLAVVSRDTMEFFKNVTRQIIAERKTTGQVRNDFLQLLINAVDEGDSSQKQGEVAGDKKDDITSNYGADEDSNHIFKSVTSKQLSMDELVAQCLIFFLAGYDTTASILALTTYNLALHPDIQTVLREEVDNVLRESNGEITYEAIQNMKYLDNVISETLRLYPPAVRLERLAAVDYKLGDTGITIPKGMLVSIPVYAMHRDAEHFPDPETFDPDRFSREKREKRDQYVYLPFGAGPRNCVGMRFALIEIKVCLAHVISSFNIRKCPQTKVPLTFTMGQTVLQPQDIILQMEARSN